MSQPHNIAVMRDGTAPVSTGPAPGSKRKATPPDDGHDQPETTDVVLQSSAMAAPKKAAKRAKLSKNNGADKSAGTSNTGLVDQDDLVMKDPPATGAVKKTKTDPKQKNTASSTDAKKKATAPVLAKGGNAETARKKQLKATQASQISTAVGNDNDNDVAMQDAPAGAAPKMANGPISLQALAAGVTTTGKVLQEMFDVVS
jgi:hypothetical protein